MLRRPFLPATDKPILLAAVVVLSACLLAAALAVIFLESYGTAFEIAVNLTVAAIFLAMSVGLWRLNRIARGATVFLLWVALVGDAVLLFGIFNPFFAMELRHATGQVPSALELALRVWPAIAAVPVIIAALHVLGKYKAEFRRSG